jgi:hypothetical protein
MALWWQDPALQVNTDIDTSKISTFDPSKDYSKAITAISNAGSQTVDTTVPDNISGLNISLTNRANKLDTLANKTIDKSSIEQAASLRPTNQYEQELRTGINQLKDYTTGNSQVDRTIANRALNRFDASQGAANLSQAQRIASNPYLSTGAKQAGIAELNRVAGAQRSELTGQLAQQSQERAFTATDKYATLSLQASEYEENKFKTDVGIVSDNLNRELNANIAAGNIETTQLSNAVNVWGTQIQTKVADANRSLNAAVAIGTLTTDQAKLQYQQIYDVAKFQADSISLKLQQNRDNITAIDVKSKLANTFTTNALNSIIEARLSNSNLTVTDIHNDPLLLQSITNSYQAETGKTDTPSDTWISSMISKARTPGEEDTLITNDSLNGARWLVDKGLISEDDFNQLGNFLKLTNEFGGMAKIGKDGSFIIDDADGNPYITIKDGKLTYEDKQPSNNNSIDNKLITQDVTVDGIVIPAGTTEGSSFIFNNNTYTYTNGKPIYTPLSDYKSPPIDFKDGNWVSRPAINTPFKMKTPSGEQIVKITSILDNGKYSVETLDGIKYEITMYNNNGKQSIDWYKNKNSNNPSETGTFFVANVEY